MTVRELALHALYRCDTEGSYVRETLDGLLNKESFTPRDRALATELVYGSVRWMGRLDWILKKFVKRVDTLTPWILNNLRLGVYQITMLAQIPDAAATNEAVKLAKRYGHPGTVKLTNAVLRNVIRKRSEFDDPGQTRNPVAGLSVAYSYPEWLISRWLERYGHEQTVALCRHGNIPPPVTVRVNRLKTDPQTLKTALEESGVEVTEGSILEDYLSLRKVRGVKSLPGFSEGWLQVQDESAGFAVDLLDPQPGETIVDLCCAPGGKTAYIAEKMKNKGRVLAVDIVPERLTRLQEHIKRLDLSIITPIAMDGRRPALSKAADRVLVDAPCSGLGTLARRVELRWRRKESDIKAAARTQAEILDHAADLVKIGGVLVYSTCTIEPEENQQVVAGFRECHPEFELDAPSAGPLDKVVDSAGMINTIPSLHGVDGSFAVRLKRMR